MLPLFLPQAVPLKGRVQILSSGFSRLREGGYPLAQFDNLCYCSLCVCVSRHWQNSKVESGQNLQSKHLKGQLGPRVGDGHFFGSMEVSWDPALVT